MSKAVIKAYDAYPLNENNRYNHEWNAKRLGYQQGYEQAEQDLALTLEDIIRLDRLIMNMVVEGYNDGYKTRPFYEEVLRRFLKRRGEA